MAVPLSNITINWANSSVTYTAMKLNALDGGSKTDSKILDIQGNNQSYFAVDKFGSTNVKTIVVDQIYANNLNVIATNINLAPVFVQANAARNHANASYQQANTAYSNYQIFTANGFLNLPSTTSTAFAIVIGGGGGGGSSSASASGQEGGYGGLTAGYAVFSPGANVFVQVGAGGIGSNSAAGTAGSTSNIGSLIATGGGGGIAAGGATRAASGIGSGGTINLEVATYFGGLYSINTSLVLAMSGSNLVGKREILYISGLTADRPPGINLLANVQYESFISTIRPGAGGTGESIGITQNNASGGVDGAVLVFY